MWDIYTVYNYCVFGQASIFNYHSLANTLCSCCSSSTRGCSITSRCSTSGSSSSSTSCGVATSSCFTSSCGGTTCGCCTTSSRVSCCGGGSRCGSCCSC